MIKITPNTYNACHLHIDTEMSNDKPTNKNRLSIGFWKWYIEIKLPNFIKPKRTIVLPNWDQETIDRLGRDYYIQYSPKTYGISFCDECVLIYYGIQTFDSTTDKVKCYQIPWLHHTFTDHQIFNANGTFVGRISKNDESSFHNDFSLLEFYRKQAEKYIFEFSDYDGEIIHATCHFEERIWHRGTSWCSWLKYITADLSRYVLEIEFSKEVGSRKNSWKGGTIAHSIDSIKGESAYDAFNRYCDQNSLKFIAQVA